MTIFHLFTEYQSHRTYFNHRFRLQQKPLGDGVRRYLHKRLHLHFTKT